MATITIGQKEFELQESEVFQQDLLFYKDNPRVYSALRENGNNNPTQTEIQEKMCSMEHVKELKSQIQQNGGLIEPLVVVEKDGRLVVLEGNSRLAAYRLLFEGDPYKWGKVRVNILPSDITESQIFTLIGTYHLVKKKDWSIFEQAAYVYRQKELEQCSYATLAKKVGLSQPTVKKYCEIYGFMIANNDTVQSHWNMYEQYLRNKGIGKYRETYPEMDDLVVKQIKTGEIKKATDVRDVLGKIASDEGKSSKHIMKDYISGEIDMETAHARFEATGRSGDNYDKIKKFQKLVTSTEFCNELKKEAVGNGNDIYFSLKKIYVAVTALMKEIKK